MSSQTRIRLLALAVIAVGGLTPVRGTAQSEPVTDWYTCLPSGSCATTDANAACAAISGTGWWGYCASAGSPFAEPCPSDKDKLHCFAPVIIP